MTAHVFIITHKEELSSKWRKMRRSGKKARKLIEKHFSKKTDGLTTRYIPITEDADKYWRLTGICVQCGAQAISKSTCKRCGKEHNE